MREIITTSAEVSGAVLIAVGIGLILGVGAALIAAGILTIAGAYFGSN